MSDANLYEFTRSFFNDFDAAFKTFSGPKIAERYQTPYLAIRSDGTTQSFTTNQDVADYFQQILDGYHTLGARTCTHSAPEIAPAGAQAVFASVTWTLLNTHGEPVASWQESYNLVNRAGRMLVCASLDHA